MIIRLSPQRREHSLVVARAGSSIVVNGETFDFSPMDDGDTLPLSAIQSEWLAGDVYKSGGELTLTLLLPIPWNYSQEQAFPVDLVNVPDGLVMLPRSLPDENGNYPDLPESIEPVAVGIIDWSQLVTKSMKDAALAAVTLASSKSELALRNNMATVQIARIQDRVDTLGYGIETGEATEEDEAEQAALLLNLKAWKTYKFALGKVTVQPTWYAAPVWPVEPVVPVIVADPQAVAADLI